MQKGQKVIIRNTNSVWDGKEGIVEEISEDKATVFVNFIPEQQKRVRQDFNLENLEEEVTTMNEDLDKRLDEEDSDETTQRIIKALMNYFKVDEDAIEVSSWGGGHNFIVNDEEYWVGDYDEAYGEAVEIARSNLDDLGLEALAPDYRDYALKNFGDPEMVKDWMRESFEYYIDDIESENGGEFDNRLIEEMYDEGILTDDDFEELDGEPDYSTLKDTVDLEDKKEQYLDSLCNQDALDWLFNTFGDSDASKMLEDYGAIDFDAVAEDCVDTDGIAHYIADYDGDEIELEDGLYAYRRG